jgi:hypothetical protein
MIFSFFLFLVLVFVRVHASSVSHIATYVDEIDKLVPAGQKKPFIVKFFKDPKNLEILNKIVQNDVPSVQNVFIEIWNRCLRCSCQQCLEIKYYNTNRDAFLSHLNCPDKFSLEDAVRDLAAFLETYDYFYRKGLSSGGMPIGQMVDTMIGSLKNLNPENWDKEFFAKLQKAFNNEDYRTETEKVDDGGKKDSNKNDDGKSENKGNGVGNDNQTGDNTEKVDDGGNKNDDGKNENKGNGGVNDHQTGDNTEKVDDSGNKNDGEKDGNNGNVEKDGNNGNVEKDGNNGNSGGNGNNGGGNYLFYYILAILLILVVVFFILRHRKQASTLV